MNFWTTKINFFKDRALFFITYPINEQAQKGDWDFKLLPIYYIAILDFPYDEHEEIRKFDRNVQLCDEDGFVFYDKLGFRFLQMPFFNKKETELVTHYDKWCYFLKYLQSFDDIPQILNEPVFDKAFKTAALAAMNPKDREEYEQSKLVYSELKAVMDTSKAEGREQGMEEGIEIGIPKGEINKARKIAKTMKDNGERIAKIAEYTGLSKEEIEKLWCEHNLIVNCLNDAGRNCISWQVRDLNFDGWIYVIFKDTVRNFVHWRVEDQTMIGGWL